MACHKLEISITQNIIGKICKNERDLCKPGERNGFVSFVLVINWFSSLLMVNPPIGGTSF